MRVTNISHGAGLYVVITDDLDAPVPGYLDVRRPVGDAERRDDRHHGRGPVHHGRLLDDYGPLRRAQTRVLRFRAWIAPTRAIGTRVTNTGDGEVEQPAADGERERLDRRRRHGRRRHPERHGVARRELRHDSDANERVLEGWTRRAVSQRPACTRAVTDANGVYRISGVAPNYDGRQLRAALPRAGRGASTAKLGRADSAFTNDLQRITDIVVQSGSNLQNLNLPIDPNGVVYNSMSRTPIAGATRDDCQVRRAPRCRRLLRRSGAAGPGHAGRRLLPLRSELLRSGVPERRQLPDRT